MFKLSNLRSPTLISKAHFLPRQEVAITSSPTRLPYNVSDFFTTDKFTYTEKHQLPTLSLQLFVAKPYQFTLLTLSA